MSTELVKSPFERLRENLHDAIDRWTGGILNRNSDIENTGSDFWPTTMMTWGGPPVEVTEDETNVIVKAEMPGLKKDDFNVELTGNRLVIRGEKKTTREEKKGETHFSECRYGAFMRSVMLPCEVNADKIDANYKDGVLRMTMPKTEAAKARKINVHLN